MSIEHETVTNLRSYYKELLVFRDQNKVEHVIRDTTTNNNKHGLHTLYYDFSYEDNERMNAEIYSIERILTVIDKL